MQHSTKSPKVCNGFSPSLSLATRFNRATCQYLRRAGVVVSVAVIFVRHGEMDGAVAAFTRPPVTLSRTNCCQRRYAIPDPLKQPSSVFPENAVEETLTQSFTSLVGEVDERRIVFPELLSGEVPRMFSSLSYQKSSDGKLSAVHAAGSTLGATALVAGTTVGAGILALPTATAPAGFIPSTVCMGVVWILMTMSGLLIAELAMNRFGETGRPGLGLLDLYESKLGKSWGYVGSTAYFFLHYAMMVAYIAQGGANLNRFLQSLDVQSVSHVPGLGQLLFAGICGLALYIAKPSLVEKANNALVFGVFASFLGILSIGAASADFEALVSTVNQHPEKVITSFPILFLALVYQNVVPTVVAQLEGDRYKITSAIAVGTTLPFVMFVAWNAVILGNVLRMDSPGVTNPISILQRESADGQLLSNLVGVFSELALITSLIGFVYGLLDALTDVFGLPSEGPTFQKWKPALFAGLFLPPLALSASNPDIFYQALDYGGAFGVSTLFLVLPPIMVWRSRYGDTESPLTTKPIVPFGKLPLVFMLAASGFLILQQTYEKLS